MPNRSLHWSHYQTVAQNGNSYVLHYIEARDDHQKSWESLAKIRGQYSRVEYERYDKEQRAGFEAQAKH